MAAPIVPEHLAARRASSPRNFVTTLNRAADASGYI
jgi:hypothetical protein